MHPFHRIVLSALLLSMPTAAFAMTETVWDFRQGNLPGTWRIADTDTPAMTDDGLRVAVSKPAGSILTELKLPHPITVISLTIQSAATTNAVFLWHKRGAPTDSLYQLPFTIPASPTGSQVELNVSAYPQWDDYTDTIGITFPKGTDVLLQEIRFKRWNIFEQAGEAWKSFWTFDGYKPFSINFLWGPVVAFNPLATQELFFDLPPHGKSGMWIFYALVVLAAAGIAGYRFAAPDKRLGWLAHLSRAGRTPEYLALGFLCFGLVWVLSDIRMGLELLNYVRLDFVTYVLPPQNSRIFRSYLNFNDVMDQSQPILAKEKDFAFLTSPGMPVTAMVQYFALPAQAVIPEGPRDDLRVWLVFKRNDVGVDEQGRITVEGIPWSRPGKVLKQFDNDVSFIFETTEP